MSLVHPGAVIDPAANLAPGVEVGPFVVVEAGVSVGSGSRLLAGTMLRRGTVLGSNCVVGPYAVLGSEPMDTSFRGEDSGVIVGNDVQIRDFASIHRATGESECTRVGDSTLVMTYVHVSHNVLVGNNVVLTSGTQLGGHSVIGDGAVLGSGAHLHQFVHVGRLAMVGAMSGVNRDVLPFSMVHGLMARHYGLNRVGLKRNGISGERYTRIGDAMRFLRRRDRSGLEELAGQNADAAELLDFVTRSSRGILHFAGGRS